MESSSTFLTPQKRYAQEATAIVPILQSMPTPDVNVVNSPSTKASTPNALEEPTTLGTPPTLKMPIIDYSATANNAKASEQAIQPTAITNGGCLAAVADPPTLPDDHPIQGLSHAVELYNTSLPPFVIKGTNYVSRVVYLAEKGLRPHHTEPAILTPRNWNKKSLYFWTLDLNGQRIIVKASPNAGAIKGARWVYRPWSSAMNDFESTPVAYSTIGKNVENMSSYLHKYKQMESEEVISGPLVPYSSDAAGAHSDAIVGCSQTATETTNNGFLRDADFSDDSHLSDDEYVSELDPNGIASVPRTRCDPLPGGWMDLDSDQVPVGNSTSDESATFSTYSLSSDSSSSDSDDNNAAYQKWRNTGFPPIKRQYSRRTVKPIPFQTSAGQARHWDVEDAFAIENSNPASPSCVQDPPTVRDTASNVTQARRSHRTRKTTMSWNPSHAPERTRRHVKPTENKSDISPPAKVGRKRKVSHSGDNSEPAAKRQQNSPALSAAERQRNLPALSTNSPDSCQIATDTANHQSPLVLPEQSALFTPTISTMKQTNTILLASWFSSNITRRVGLKLRSCMTIEALFNSVMSATEISTPQPSVSAIMATFDWKKEDDLQRRICVRRSVPDSFEVFLNMIDESPCWEEEHGKCVVAVEVVLP